MARLITAVSVAVATSFTLASANVEASDIPTSQSEVEITLPTFSGGQPLFKYLISIDPTRTSMDNLEAAFRNAGASVVNSISDFKFFPVAVTNPDIRTIAVVSANKSAVKQGRKT